MVFNTDASKLQAYIKHRVQLFIENVFPMVMKLSLITVSRVANLLKKLLSRMVMQTYREKNTSQIVSKSNFFIFYENILYLSFSFIY
jgi:hypothetical protein